MCCLVPLPGISLPNTFPNPYTGAVLDPGRIAPRVTSSSSQQLRRDSRWSPHWESTSPAHAMARERKQLSRLLAPRASRDPTPTSPGALLLFLTLRSFASTPCGLASPAVGRGRNVSDMHIDMLRRTKYPVCFFPFDAHMTAPIQERVSLPLPQNQSHGTYTMVSRTPLYPLAGEGGFPCSRCARLSLCCLPNNWKREDPALQYLITSNSPKVNEEEDGW